jgi:hypothetical protein
MTHHNFVQWPVIWVHPKVDAYLEEHDSGESAKQAPGFGMERGK